MVGEAMNIKYVVSMMVFWGLENPLSFEQDCQFLKSLGFGVELWPTIKATNECRYEKRNWQRLASATRGMSVSMRSRTDKPTLKQWQEQIQCAKLLGANIVADLASLGIEDQHNLNGCDFAARVIEMAKADSVELSLETGSLELVKKMGRRFDSLKYCLDTGYAHLDDRNDFRTYVDELMDRLGHLHLTDNYGRIDDHQPPGLNGGIPQQDWDYLLNALMKSDKKVIGSLEMFPCAPYVMIRRACEFLFGEQNWPGKPGNGNLFSDRIQSNPNTHGKELTA